MNNTSETNISLENATDSSKTVPPKAEGIALCSAFIVTSVFIFVGNLLAIVLFTVNKRLRKKSLFLVINMAFADLMLGTVSLPIYIYIVGADYQLWKVGLTMPLVFSHWFSDVAFTQASLVSAALISCERFYAVYWPFKHRTLSMKVYHIVIFVVWTLALLLGVFWAVWDAFYSLTPNKHAEYIWSSYILILLLIVCGCSIGIWRKLRQQSIAQEQQDRASKNKRLTKTLLFVSVLALLSWLPVVVMNILVYVYNVPIPWRFYFLVVLVNCSNSFINPIVYALRIPEFKKALTLCCLGREAYINYEEGERRNNAAAVMTPATQRRTILADPSHINLPFEEEVMDTKL